MKVSVKSRGRAGQLPRFATRKSGQSAPLTATATRTTTAFVTCGSTTTKLKPEEAAGDATSALERPLTPCSRKETSNTSAQKNSLPRTWTAIHLRTGTSYHATKKSGMSLKLHARLTQTALGQTLGKFAQKSSGRRLETVVTLQMVNPATAGRHLSALEKSSHPRTITTTTQGSRTISSTSAPLEKAAPKRS